MASYLDISYQDRLTILVQISEDFYQGSLCIRLHLHTEWENTLFASGNRLKSVFVAKQKNLAFIVFKVIIVVVVVVVVLVVVLVVVVVELIMTQYS